MKKLLYLLAVLPAVLLADTKIINLPEDLSPSATNYTYETNGTSFKVKFSNIPGFGAGGSSVYPSTSSLAINYGLTSSTGIFTSTMIGSNIVDTLANQKSFLTQVIKSSYVNVGPYGQTADVSGAYWGGGTTSREFITVGQQWRIRQRGTISKVELYWVTSTGVTEFKVRIWRKVGTTYNLVGETEDLLPKLTFGMDNIITLTQPISGVQEGDYYGYRLVSSAASPMVAKSGYANMSSYCFDNTAAKGNGTNWDTGYDFSFSGFAVPINLYMNSPNIILLGDSITQGSPNNFAFTQPTYTVVSTTAYWGHNLSLALNWTYQNMGHGGDYTTDMVSRFTQDVINERPRYVTIFGGANDLLNSVSTTTTFANLCSMYNSAQSNGIVPIAIPVLPGSSGFYGTALSRARDDLNRAIVSTVSAYGGIAIRNIDNFMGQYRAGGDPGNFWDINPTYTFEGLHLSTAGNYQLMYAILSNLGYLKTNSINVGGYVGVGQDLNVSGLSSLNGTITGLSGITTTTGTFTSTVTFSGPISAGGVGTAGYVLQSNGDNNAPSWVSPGSGSGVSVYPATQTIQANYGIYASTIEVPIATINHIYSGGQPSVDPEDRFLSNLSGNSVFTWVGNPNFTSTVTFSDPIDASGVGSPGQVLQSNGAGNAPSWTSVAGGSGSLIYPATGPTGAYFPYGLNTSSIVFNGVNAGVLGSSNPLGAPISVTITTVTTNLTYPYYWNYTHSYILVAYKLLANGATQYAYPPARVGWYHPANALGDAAGDYQYRVSWDSSPCVGITGYKLILESDPYIGSYMTSYVKIPAGINSITFPTAGDYKGANFYASSITVENPYKFTPPAGGYDAYFDSSGTFVNNRPINANGGINTGSLTFTPNAQVDARNGFNILLATDAYENANPNIYFGTYNNNNSFQNRYSGIHFHGLLGNVASPVGSMYDNGINWWGDENGGRWLGGMNMNSNHGNDGTNYQPELFIESNGSFYIGPADKNHIQLGLYADDGQYTYLQSQGLGYWATPTHPQGHSMLFEGQATYSDGATSNIASGAWALNDTVLDSAGTNVMRIWNPKPTYDNTAHDWLGGGVQMDIGKSTAIVYNKFLVKASSYSLVGISTITPTSIFASTIVASIQFTIPSGTSPDVNSIGTFAIDTSSSQVLINNGANIIVIPSTYSKTLNLETPAVGDFPIGWRPPADITISQIVCVSSAATSTTITLKDCSGSDGTSCNTLQSGAVCGTTEFSVNISSDVAAGRRIRPQVTATSGTPGWVGVDVYYREKRK